MTSEFRYILNCFIDNERRLGREAHVDAIICDLLEMNKMNNTKLGDILCGIEALLQNYTSWGVNFSKEIFRKLIQLMKVDEGFATNLPHQIILCLKQYFRQFPLETNQDLVEELWQITMDIDNETHGLIIVEQLFELFCRRIDNFLYTELPQVIQKLMLSMVKDRRKTGLILMDRQTDSIRKSNGDESGAILKALGWRDKPTYMWCIFTYMNVWKQIEGRPDEAIPLPMISIMAQIQQLMEQTTYSWNKVFLDLLYVLLLGEDDIAVTRLIIEHIISYYQYYDLSLRLQLQFRYAIDNVLLYNVNGDFLYRESIPLFLNRAREQFLDAFIEMDCWSFVSTHFWFSFLANETMYPSISIELLLKLAECVGRQSSEIRAMMQTHFLCNIFQSTIKSLSLHEYIAYTELLYDDDDDNFYNSYEFIELLDRYPDLNLSAFEIRFYKILTSSFNNYDADGFLTSLDRNLNGILEDALDRLRNKPKKQHGWLRFLLVFNLEQNDFIIKYCRDCYNLDIVQLKNDDLSLKAFHRLISEKLVINQEEESDYIQSKCVDLYTEYQLKKWSDLEKLPLDPLLLITMGNLHTYTRLLKLLGDHDTPDVSNRVLFGFFEKLKEAYIKRKFVCEIFVKHIYNYGEAHMSDSDLEDLCCKILNLDIDNRILAYQVVWRMKMSKNFLLRGLLHGEPSFGVSGVQEAYEEIMLQTVPTTLGIRHCFKSKEQPHLNSSVIDDLLRINNDISVKVPEYHEKSMVHRLKIRITQAIFGLQELHRWEYWSEDLWTALLAKFNQRNIRYLYELMIIKFAKETELLLVKIRQISKYSGANKLSLLSVIYNYCMINEASVSDEHMLEVTDLIMPLTLDDNTLVRQYAQVMFYVLVRELDSKGIKKPDAYDDLQRNARIALGDERMVELLLHPRFKMHEYYKQSQIFVHDMLLYVTNAPIDECLYWIMRTSFDSYFQAQFDKCRIRYIQEMSTKPIKYIQAADELNFSFGPYSMDPKPIWETLHDIDKSEMIVVTHLIDNILDFAGVVVRCDSIGVQKIWLANEKMLEALRFRNIKVSSNLSYYRIRYDELVSNFERKKKAGYTIVGTALIADKILFYDFKFSEKCILLLGHETNGIPLELQSVLDHVVMIPPFQNARNVQSRSFFYMMEYMKQHKPKTENNPVIVSNPNKMELNWRNIILPSFVDRRGFIND